MISFIIWHSDSVSQQITPILSSLYTFHYTVLVTVNVDYVVPVTFKCSRLLYVGYSPTEFLTTIYLISLAIM
jgi:hypothetical protein